MPTIDIRGQPPGAGGGAKDPKAQAEEQRRRAMVRAYQSTVRKDIEDALKERATREKADRKRIIDTTKSQELQRRAAEKEMRDRAAAQRRQTQEALRLEKQKQRYESAEIKKKQRLEERAAEKAQRETARVEQAAVKAKQKEEAKIAKEAERTKLQAAKEAAKTSKQEAAAQAKAQKQAAAQAAQQQRAQVLAQKQAASQANAAQRAQVKAAAQAQRAAVQAARQSAQQQRAQQMASNRANSAIMRAQPKFARQQSAILAHFNTQNAPAGAGGGGAGAGAGGGAAPAGRPFFRHNAADILAESFTGAAIAGLVPTFVKILAAGIGAAIEAPLITGQMQRGMLSLAEPLIDLMKPAYAMGRAGGFKGADLTRLMFPGTGTEAGSEWMSRYMTNPQKVMESLGAFGIVQPNAWRSAGLGEVFARQALMPGFSGMENGTVESVARQRAGYGRTSVEGVDKYLNQIAGAMELAIAKGMDRSKVLDSIQGAMDQVAKSGAAGISNKAILDMVARFGASGTPGGRTGEQAAAAMGAMGQFASSPSSNPGMMFLAYSQMRKYGGLRTENDIKQFVGDENWNAASPSVRKLATRDITAASASGNPFAAFQIASQVLMGANPGRMAELLQDPLKAAFPSFLRSSALGSVMGGVANSYAYEAGAGATSPGARGVLGPSSLPPGVGSAENSAAQATLSGANIILQNWVPIMKSLSDEMEKLGHNVLTVNKAYEALHSPGNTYPGWWSAFGHNVSLLGQPGQPATVKAVPVNPNHQ